VKLTPICCGEVLAPGALTVTVPVYVPAASPAVAAVTVSVLGAVPVLGLTPNHAWLLVALQFSVPPPVLLMLIVRAAGFAPPSTALKLRLVGLTPNAGGTGALTVKVTVTLCGAFSAPGALTVTAPV
jgi:hypothetical protein